jgi:F-type H+-transporting ATPase subunit alpha
MKQGEFQPLPVEHQIALLKINNEGLLDELAVDQIREFEAEYLQTISSKFDEELTALAASGVLDDKLGDKLVEAAKTLIHQMTLDA